MKHRVIVVLALGVLVAGASLAVQAQIAQTESASSMSVPRLVAFNGAIRSGSLTAGVISVRFAVYKDQFGGSPLWSEIQNVQLDEQGRYGVLMGAYSREGLPMDLFTSGESRWLGVQAQVAGEEEQPRVLLVSVPYALKAADADTLGGRPASAFVLSPKSDGTKGGTEESVENPITTDEPTVSEVSGTGTAGKLTKWLDTNGALGDSVVTESGGNIGIGTASPVVPLEVVGASELLRLTGTGNTMLSFLSSGADREGRAFLLDQFGNFYIYNTTDSVPEIVINGSHYVGVGTANPAAPFHVFNSGPSFAHIEGTSAGIDVGWLIKNNAPGARQWAIRSSGAGKLLFRDDSTGTERVTLDSNGNLGIGNSSPAARLDVSGTVNATGAVSATSFAGNGSALTNVNAASVEGVAGAAMRTRVITYLAGCDTCNDLVQTDDQRTIFLNLYNSLTINSVTCISNIGAATIQLQKDDGGPVNMLSGSPALTCATGNGNTTSSFISGENILALNDKIDFSVENVTSGTPKRLTVVIKATVNP